MTWEAVLDELEANVARAESALDAGTDLDPALLVGFAPPAGLSPLPAELQDRAVDVLRRQQELEMRLNTAVEALGRDLAANTRATGAARRPSPFGDSVVPRYFDVKG